MVHPRVSSWLGFVGWLLIGGVYTLSLLTAFTIGVFVLPVAIIATLLLARRHRPADELFGLVAGLGLPVLFVAYLNRDGPGNICTTARDGAQSCTEKWSPWPWLAAGLLLVVTGIVAFVADRRRRAQLHG